MSGLAAQEAAGTLTVAAFAGTWLTSWMAVRGKGGPGGRVIIFSVSLTLLVYTVLAWIWVAAR